MKTLQKHETKRIEMFMNHQEEETQYKRIKCPVLTAFRTLYSQLYAL